MAALPVYLHDIRSLKDRHPNLPAALGRVDINRGIQANTPIDPGALVHAQAVVKILTGIKELGQDPLVTDAVVQSAELRARAVEAAHATAEYAPINLGETLQNINNLLANINNRLANIDISVANINDRLANIDISVANSNGRLDELSMMTHESSAMAHNNRILALNAQRRARQVPQPYLPPRKMIVGHGLTLARAVAHNPGIRNGLKAPNPIPGVNTTPQDFNPDTSNYGHQHILDLIIFYNDDFGILQGDTLPARVEKFRGFLTEI